DVTVILGASTTIKGTLVLNDTNTGFTFLKTGSALAAGLYTVTLVSGTSAFVDAAGVPLDGNSDGVPDDSFVTTFAVAAANVAVGVADFTRGPDAAHNINLPSNTSNGVPITLSSAAGVTSGHFVLSYDPTLLTISGATANSTLAGSSFTLSGASTSGNAILDF